MTPVLSSSRKIEKTNEVASQIMEEKSVPKKPLEHVYGQR